MAENSGEFDSYLRTTFPGLPSRWRNHVLATLLACCLGGCASNPDRPSGSSLSCMQSARDSLPEGLDDARAHCMAAGLIARQCSRFEARLAGAGKEFADLFTGGDPSWSDWKADRAGIHCAAAQNDREGLAACCVAAGY